MKIVIISDTHGQDFVDQIPECDLLLHCGDISPDPAWTGNWNDFVSSVYDFQENWINNVLIKDFIPRLKAKHFAFIAGNHDFYLESLMKNKAEDFFRSKLPDNCSYLRDTLLQINGIKIWGTPWVTNLTRWAFNEKEGKLIYKYSNMPENLDILLTHSPAKGYCDTIKEHKETEHLGSSSLRNIIYAKHPKWVFNGHIHSGEHSPSFANVSINTKFVNASLLNESYEFHYPPFVLNWPN